MANIIQQLVALYVLMAEQIDSMICTLQGKKRLSVSVIKVLITCYFSDKGSSLPTLYAEIWTL